MAKHNAEFILDANIRNQTDELNNLLGKGEDHTLQFKSSDNIISYMNGHDFDNHNAHVSSNFHNHNINYPYDNDQKLTQEQHIDEYFKMLTVQSALEQNRNFQLNTKLSLNAKPFVPKQCHDSFLPNTGNYVNNINNNDQRLNQPRRMIKKSLPVNPHKMENKTFMQNNFPSIDYQNDLNKNGGCLNKKYHNTFKKSYQYDKDYYECTRELDDEINIRNLNIGPQINNKTPSIKMFEKLKSCWVLLNSVINEHTQIETLLATPATSYKIDQLIEDNLFKNNNLYLLLQKITEILHYEIYSLETLFMKIQIIFYEYSINFIDGSKEILYELMECFQKLKNPKTVQYLQMNAMINDQTDTKIIFNNFDDFLNILKYTNSYVWSLRETLLEHINRINLSKNARNIFIGN